MCLLNGGSPVGVFEGRLSTGVRIWGLAAAATLLIGTATTASAAAGQDEVSNVGLAVACAPYDNIHVRLSFQVEAGPDTPAAGRLTDVSGKVQYKDEVSGESSGETEFHLDVPGGAEFFATGDYGFDLSDYAQMSITERDTFDVTLSYANGDVAATDTVTVACFDGGDDVTPHDFTVKARVGVPRTFRLLEHTTFGDVNHGYPEKAWVTEDGAVVDALAAPSDLLDLAPATDAALGASLADQALTVTPTAAGTYELDWGIVSRDNEYTRVEITEDPQVVAFPYTQDVVVKGDAFYYNNAPLVCDSPGVCRLDLSGSWEPEVAHLVGPTTYTFVGLPVFDVYVKTNETVATHGPAGMTLEVIDAPIQPDASEIVDSSRGDVDVAGTAEPGDSLTVDVGDDMAGGYVDVWLNSTPTYLGLFPVGPSGTVDVTVPTDFVAGEHRVVVTDEVGTFVGWDNLSVSRTGGSDQLAATGIGHAAWAAQAAAAAALLAWGIVMVRRSRRTS